MKQGYIMRNFLASTALILSASMSHADGYLHVGSVVTHVNPIYKLSYTPVQQKQCYTVQTPTGGDVLAGALIGGFIGNQFGNGDGKDAMTVIGAVIGANSVANTPVYGSRCEITTIYQEVYELDYYEVTYVNNNSYYKVNTRSHFNVGDKIIVK
jgi:uncharacterized protein YcfJ